MLVTGCSDNEDFATDCQNYANPFSCDHPNPIISDWMLRNCLHSCGRCPNDSSTTSPSPATGSTWGPTTLGISCLLTKNYNYNCT